MITPPNTPARRTSKRRVSIEVELPARKRKNSLSMRRQRRVKKKYTYKSPAYKKKVKSNRKKVKKSYKKSVNKFTSKKTVFQSKGFVQNDETYGNVADPDCVYVGHTTFDLEIYAKVIAYAILRKLLNKGGWFPTEIDQDLALSGISNSSSGYFFILTLAGVVDTAGGAQTFYSTGFTEDMENLNTNLGLATKIQAQMANLGTSATGQDGNSFEFVELSLHYGDGTDLNRKSLISKIDFRSEKIDVFCRSELVLQNRTKGATSSDVDATAIDNQMLQGYMYEGNGVPITKTSNPQNDMFWDLNRVTKTGLILAQANGNPFPVSGGGTPVVTSMNPVYKEPPIPASFMNCKKSKSVLLQSGQYGRFVLYSKFHGLFNVVLGKTLVYTGRDGSTNLWRKFIRAPGKFQFLALEEVLNSGSTNKIDIAWQVQRTAGAYLTTTSKRIMFANHTERKLTVNGLPP